MESREFLRVNIKEKEFFYWPTFNRVDPKKANHKKAAIHPL